jgi:hypothetical protein
VDKKCKPYLFEYYHDGSWWGIPIKAYSEADARERMNKMPHAKSLGETVAVIPASRTTAVPLGLMVRLVCWWRNLQLHYFPKGK